jgi:trimeric autotransporter adhesin
VQFALLGNAAGNVLRRIGDTGPVVLDGQAGDDTLNEQSNTSRMSDTLLGGAGNDTLISHGGVDLLDGGVGDDFIQVGYQVFQDDQHPQYQACSNGQRIRFGVGSGHDSVFYDGEYAWESKIVPAPRDVYPTDFFVEKVDAGYAIAGHQIAIEVDANVDPTTLSFSQTSTILTIALNAQDSMKVYGFFGGNNGQEAVSPINRLVFGGAFLTEQIMAAAVGKTSFVTATAGDDILIATPGAGVQVMGAAGNDYIAGGALAQRLDGGAGADTLVSGDGDDTLVGGKGDDTLCGGLGADTYVFSTNWGHDLLNEATLLNFNEEHKGSGFDDVGVLNTISFDDSVKKEDIELDWVWELGLTITNKVTGDTILVGSDYRTMDEPDSAPSPENVLDQIKFADGTVWDRRTIEWGNKLVYGTAGSDDLHDNESGTLVYGLAGNDTLTAAFVETQLYGGDGEDTLTTTVDSGPFGDQIYMHGDAGNDSITGGAFYDLLDGGTGTDTMTGGAGDDVYYVDSGADLVIEALNGGYDSVYATDTVSLTGNVEWLQLESSGGAINGTGNAMNNWIEGNEYANKLYGGDLRDTLEGGDGADTLDGGTGMDTLEGGLGADTYNFLGASYSVDTINEGDGESPDVHDKVDFGTKKSTDYISSKHDNNLEISLNGSGAKLIIQDWYLGDEHQVEQFVFADKTLNADQIETLGQTQAHREINVADETQSPFAQPGSWNRIWYRPDRRVGDPSSTEEARRHALSVAGLVQAMASFDSSGALHTSGSHVPWGEPLMGRPVDVAVHTLLV